MKKATSLCGMLALATLIGAFAMSEAEAQPLGGKSRVASSTAAGTELQSVGIWKGKPQNSGWVFYGYIRNNGTKPNGFKDRTRKYRLSYRIGNGSWQYGPWRRVGFVKAGGKKMVKHPLSKAHLESSTVTCRIELNAGDANRTNDVKTVSGPIGPEPVQ